MRQKEPHQLASRFNSSSKRSAQSYKTNKELISSHKLTSDSKRNLFCNGIAGFRSAFHIALKPEARMLSGEV